MAQDQWVLCPAWQIFHLYIIVLHMQLHCCAGVAKYVLDKCVPERSNNPKSERYEVAFDYEFIDDFQDSEDEDGHETNDPE